jgi:hypothetical protein
MPNKFNHAKLPSWKGLSGAAANLPLSAERELAEARE